MEHTQGPEVWNSLSYIKLAEILKNFKSVYSFETERSEAATLAQSNVFAIISTELYFSCVCTCHWLLISIRFHLMKKFRYCVYILLDK